MKIKKIVFVRKATTFFFLFLVGFPVFQKNVFAGVRETIFSGIGGVFVGAASAVGIPRLYKKFLHRSDSTPSDGPFSCVEVKDLSLKDFVGQDLVVEEAGHFLDALSYNDALSEEGNALRIKGLCLEGQKDSGKTFLAYIVASEIEASIIHVPGDFLTAGGLNEIEARFAFAFNFAIEKSNDKKIVLLFDQLEKVFEESIDFEKILSSFLNSIEEHNNLVVIFERRPVELDGPDFFDSSWKYGLEKIKIFFPNLVGRYEMLQKCFARYDFDPSLSSAGGYFETVARIVQGTQFDFYKKFSERVARVAMRDNGVITRKHIKKVLKKIGSGVKRDVVQTEEELLMTAYHEAGHALMATLLGKRVFSATIQLREGSVGSTSIDMTSLYDDTICSNLCKKNLIHEIMIYFGGPCAEELVQKGAMTVGSRGDLDLTGDFAERMVKKFGMGNGRFHMITGRSLSSTESEKMFDDEIIDMLSRCRDTTKKMLGAYEEVLEELATRLYQEETLYEEDVCEIVGQPRDESDEFLKLFF